MAMQVQRIVELCDVSQVLHSPAAECGRRRPAKIKIQKSGNKPAKKSLPQFAKSGFSGKRTDRILCISTAPAKEVGRLQADETKQGFTCGLLCHFAQI